MCVLESSIYSLFNILDLHTGCAVAAGTHEGFSPQLKYLCTPCLNTHTPRSDSDNQLHDYSIQPILFSLGLKPTADVFTHFNYVSIIEKIKKNILHWPDVTQGITVVRNISKWMNININTESESIIFHNIKSSAVATDYLLLI